MSVNDWFKSIIISSLVSLASFDSIGLKSFLMSSENSCAYFGKAFRKEDMYGSDVNNKIWIKSSFVFNLEFFLVWCSLYTLYSLFRLSWASSDSLP